MYSTKFEDIKKAASSVYDWRYHDNVVNSILDVIDVKYGYTAVRTVCRMALVPYPWGPRSLETSPDFSGAQAIRDYGREFPERYNALEYGDD